MSNEPQSRRHTERHFSPEKLADLWDVSANKIRRLFEHEPGVLFLDRPEEMHKRGYRIMRIPESVAARVHAKLEDASAPTS